MGRHIDTLKALIEAWKRRDIDGVLAFMADDIVWHYAVAAMPPVRGKAAARKLLNRLSADMHEVTWRIFDHAETADRLFVEGVDEYQTADGVAVATPYAGVLDFRDGRICGWRDYVDVGVMTAQREGAPRTAHVIELLDRAEAV